MLWHPDQVFRNLGPFKALTVVSIIPMRMKQSAFAFLLFFATLPVISIRPASAQYTPTTPTAAAPFSEAEIIGALRDGSTNRHITTEVGYRGVAFAHTPAVDQRLRRAD